jgi:CDP-L-myo-inositol myo-inositolphosphotransferase
MKALIIAAGQGRRLNDLTNDQPKPLIQLLGLSLIERVILTAKHAGIHDFVITVGYLGDKIRATLGDGRGLGVRIDYVQNKEWEKGNGASVLRATPLLNENFILLMSDHIFDDRILKGLVDHELGSSVVLAVDRRAPWPGDTKVLEARGKILSIGKDIEESNCIDTGIFLCSPRLLAFAEEAVKEGKTELADVIDKAARNGEAEVFDITRMESHSSRMGKGTTPWWIDIDTREDLRKAEQYLIKKENSLKTLCLLHRNMIFRKFGVIEDRIREGVATLLLELGIPITPNQITILSFVVGILSGVSFALSHLLLGGILYYLSDVLDGVDGVVARRTGTATTYGAYLDSCLDRYVDVFVVLGICVHFSQVGYIWIIGVLAITGNLMISYATHRAEALGKVVLTSRIRWYRRRRMHIIIVGAFLSLFYPSSLFYALATMAVISNLKVFWRMMPWMLKDFNSVDKNTRKLLARTSLRKFQKHKHVI